MWPDAAAFGDAAALHPVIPPPSNPTSRLALRKPALFTDAGARPIRHPPLTSAGSSKSGREVRPSPLHLGHNSPYIPNISDKCQLSGVCHMYVLRSFPACAGPWRARRQEPLPRPLAAPTEPKSLPPPPPLPRNAGRALPGAVTSWPPELRRRLGRIRSGSRRRRRGGGEGPAGLPKVAVGAPGGTGKGRERAGTRGRRGEASESRQRLRLPPRSCRRYSSGLRVL